MGSEGEFTTKTIQVEEEHNAFLYAMQLANSTILPMTLKAAIELGILDVLVDARRHLSTEEIAFQLRISNPDAPVMLDRILRLLASHNIVTYTLGTTDQASCSIVRSYGPAPVCKSLAKDKDCVSIVGPLLVMFHDRVFMESLYYLKDMVTHGRTPFHAAHGAELFEYMSTDARFREVFFDGMSNHSIAAMKLILDNFDGFHGVHTLVDVGGGIGASSLQMVVNRYPHIHGINFDLPHVANLAPPLPGIQHVGGDMFENVPSGDAIFMKWILHDWSDEYCLKLLRNCWKALPNNGKVIIADFILTEEAESTLTAKYGFQLDLNMFAFCKGGKERTEREFISLVNKAGFANFKIACRIPAICIMEVTK